MAGCSQRTGGIRSTRAALDRDVDAIAKEGIFVSGIGESNDCVEVYLYNPTRPNVEYLMSRYGRDGCLTVEQGSPAFACTGAQSSAAPGGVAVPDVVGEKLRRAAGTVVASGLKYVSTCAGSGSSRPPRATPNSISQYAMVVQQCPAAGAKVRRGATVELAVVVDLPGGFRHKLSDSGICANSAE